MIEYLTHNTFVIGLVGLIIVLVGLQILGVITNKIFKINDDYHYKDPINIFLGIVAGFVIITIITIIYCIGDLITKN